MINFKTFTVKSLMLATLITFGLVSCSDDDSSSSNGGSANLTVRLTDAPGDYDAVWIDVQGIEIHVEGAEDGEELEGDDDGDGWITVENVDTGVYDLLELTGGVTQLLADTEVPAGYVSQMRLILGDDNRVMIDGETKTLNTPSAQQSGLKLQLNQEFEAGENYAFLLDFNVDESIVTTGNGGYILKPVIRVNAEENAGIIVGTVSPADFQSLVLITNGSTTISAYTDADGQFSLNGVPPGTYKLTVTPDALSGYDPHTVDVVEVEPNSTTELEPIEL